MAKRLISAAVAITLGIIMLWLDRKEIIIIAVSALSAIAVYEILVATKYIKTRSVAVISLFFVAAVPFVLSYDFGLTKIRYFSFAFIILLFVVMLFNHRRVKFAEVSLVTFVSLCISFSFSCFVFLYANPAMFAHRFFNIVFVLAITFICDAGAFFVGSFLGKHKLAPIISPKKTWEGFFGGIASACLFGFLLGKGYEWVAHLFFEGGLNFKVDVLFLTVISIPCALLATLGDFSASIIKRECSVKDFGDIMPGHGGVLDRFDSVLFVAPFVYLVFSIYYPIV